MSVDGLGNPVRFILTAGNVNDIVQAEALIRGLSFDKLLADKGYDSDRFRASIAQVGAEAVIPSTRSPYRRHANTTRPLGGFAGGGPQRATDRPTRPCSRAHFSVSRTP